MESWTLTTKYIMSQPKVSIIIPIFNCEHYIEPLIHSIFDQSESCIEIIAIDDGSTDNSLLVLNQIAQHDNRLKVFSQMNIGVSATRNRGLSLCTGQWVTFADGDDWLSPDTLAKRLAIAERDQLDVLVCNAFGFVKTPEKAIESTLPILFRQPWHQILTGKNWIIYAVAQKEWPHYVWSQLISRQFINTHELRFVENIVHEDILWTMHLALKAERMGFCPKLSYGYRKVPDSITRTNNQQTITLRALNYITVIKSLLQTANMHSGMPLGKALNRHSIREAGHLLALLRRKLDPETSGHRVSQELLSQRIIGDLLRSATTIGELWKVMRLFYLVQKFNFLYKNA